MRRYFHWLQGQKFADIRQVDQETIQKYLHSCMEKMKPTSVYNIHLYLRKLYRFLWERGYTESSYETFFAFKIRRESKLFPAAEDETVDAILSVIDTQTATGKRDYAIILLGYVLGMRSVDIARLRLSKILRSKGGLVLSRRKQVRPLCFL